jgi:hypothetical protein
MKKKNLPVVLAALALGVLTACAMPTTNSPAPNSKPTFGQPFELDGVVVSITTPEEFTPGEFAAGTHDGQTNVRVTVRAVNDTDKAWNSYLFAATVLSDGKAGDQIFDTDTGLGLVAADVPPGMDVTWDMAWSVADPDDITMTVSTSIAGGKVVLSTR